MLPAFVWTCFVLDTYTEQSLFNQFDYHFEQSKMDNDGGLKRWEREFIGMPLKETLNLQLPQQSCSVATCKRLPGENVEILKCTNQAIHCKQRLKLTNEMSTLSQNSYTKL